MSQCENLYGPCSCGAQHQAPRSPAGITSTSTGKVMCNSCNVYFNVGDYHSCTVTSIIFADTKVKDKWQKFYLTLAAEFAGMSRAKNLQVGAVIVTPEGILYPGYNGDEIGGDNAQDSDEPGQSGFVHAEANAILKFNPTIHKGSVLYLTHNPCVVCARMIVNTQAISAVYYAESYRDSKGVEILQKRGIICEKVG